jgi:hypothetical protein
MLLANGRGNWAADILASGSASAAQVHVARTAKRTPALTLEVVIAQWAIAAIRAKAGNCGENAAVAFCLLHCWRVGPIAYCSSSHGDHAFVAIGGPGDSIICDPWAYSEERGHSGVGAYAMAALYSMLYRDPNIIFEKDAPAGCLLEQYCGTVEAFESMEYVSEDQGLARQLIAGPHVYTGI